MSVGKSGPCLAHCSEAGHSNVLTEGRDHRQTLHTSAALLVYRMEGGIMSRSL